MKKLPWKVALAIVFVVALLSLLVGCTNYEVVFFGGDSDESVWLVEKTITTQFKNGLKFNVTEESTLQRFGYNGYLKFVFNKDRDVVQILRRGNKQMTNTIGSYRFAGGSIAFNVSSDLEGAGFQSFRLDGNVLICQRLSEYNNGMIQVTEFYCNKIV